MKKIFLLVCLMAITMVLFAQKIRLNAYGSYVFDDKFDSYYDQYNYYNGKIKGGFQGGVSAEYMIQPKYCVELMWMHQTTTAPTYYWDGSAVISEKFTDFDVDFDYIMIGGEGHYQKPGSRIEGYGGFLLGVAIINLDNPTNGNGGSTSKFSWGGKLGCNIWASERFGIKLQALLLSISQGMGGGFYFGTSGSGVGLSSYSSIYQFSLGGGLTFKLGSN